MSIINATSSIVNSNTSNFGITKPTWPVINKVSGLNYISEVSDIPNEWILLKAYVYAKKTFSVGVEKYYDYVTVFTWIPINEFLFTIPTEHRGTSTNGVFITVIGKSSVIRPHGRVYLNKYQDMLEGLGYKFISTVKKSKGGEYETIRKQAFSIVTKHKEEKPKYKKENAKNFQKFKDCNIIVLLQKY